MSYGTFQYETHFEFDTFQGYNYRDKDIEIVSSSNAMLKYWDVYRFTFHITSRIYPCSIE